MSPRVDKEWTDTLILKSDHKKQCDSDDVSDWLGSIRHKGRSCSWG